MSDKQMFNDVPIKISDKHGNEIGRILSWTYSPKRRNNVPLPTIKKIMPGCTDQEIDASIDSVAQNQQEFVSTKSPPHVQLERNNTRVIGNKRQHAPYSLRWTCPRCLHKWSENLANGDYLNEPEFGSTTTFRLYCYACGKFEQEIQLHFDCTLKLV